VGSQRLTAWAMARPNGHLSYVSYIQLSVCLSVDMSGICHSITSTIMSIKLIFHTWMLCSSKNLWQWSLHYMNVIVDIVYHLGCIKYTHRFVSWIRFRHQVWLRLTPSNGTNWVGDDGSGPGFRSIVCFNISKMVDSFQHYIFIIFIFFQLSILNIVNICEVEVILQPGCGLMTPRHVTSRHVTSRHVTSRQLCPPQNSIRHQSATFASCVFFRDDQCTTTAFPAEITRFRVCSCEDLITWYILGPELGDRYDRRRGGWRSLNRSSTIAVFKISI
jgi:hypothetical protein